MGKLIELTFPTSPQVGNNDTIQLTATDGSNTIAFDLVFVTSGGGGDVEVIIPSPYGNIAEDFTTVWTNNYEITDFLNPRNNQFTVVSVNSNVVTLFTNNAYNWTAPTGQTITDGSVTFNIISTKSISLDAYSTVVGNECTQVDVTVSMSGGTSPYDIYVDDVLESSAVTSPHDVRINRGLSQEIKVLDNGGTLVGIADTQITTALTSDDITIDSLENASDFDVVINAQNISSVVSPYTYSDDNVTYQSSNTFTGVSSGLNTFYVKDAFGCVRSKIVALGYSLIYYFEFTDVEGVLHRVNISKLSYTGASTEINGKCILEYPENNDLQSPIKASNLSITIEANSGLTFADLYTEEERVFKVEYIRNSQTLFNGFLNPEGLYESYVADKWILELNCIDGLGYLQDLAFVDDLSGLKFTGKLSGIEIIANCLKRIKIRQNIRTDVGIKYDTLVGNVDILANTYYSVDRFEKEEEVLDCEAVLKSILQIYNASLVSFGGKWYIYRANQLFDSTNYGGFEYDSDGGALTVPTAENLAQNLGSQIDSYYPHHAGANQQKTIKRSLGAYRVSLEYGKLLPFFTNTDLIWTNTTTINEWTINQASFIEPAYDLRGFRILDTGNVIASVVVTSDDYAISGNTPLEINITATNESETDVNFCLYQVVFEDTTGGGSTLYYFSEAGFGLSRSWTTTPTSLFFNLEVNTFGSTLKLITTELPSTTGNLSIRFLGSDERTYVIESLFVTKFRGEDEPIGRNYTITKNTDATPNVEDDVTKVLFGDVPLNTFESAIFKADETTQTDKWRRNGITESKPLLQINVEDRISMQFNPRLIFKGDIYGYLPFLSVLNINNINSKMLPYAYSYDCYNNVISLSSMQLLNNTLNINDVTYSETDVYKEVIKPTIK